MGEALPDGSVSDRLARAAAESFVGRSVEIDRLTSMLKPGEGPVVVFLHGAAGIGKTALADRVARAGGGPVLWLDGESFEPTAVGLAGAVGSATPDPPAVAATIAGVASGGVFVIDGYEHLLVLDGWLRNVLLPVLSDRVTTLLVGRVAPHTGWRLSPGWSAVLGEMELGPLTESDARAVVAARGLGGAEADRVAGFARGHPLAIELAAAAVARRPSVDVEAGPPPEVVEELTEVLLSDLAAEPRRIVEAASVVRQPTAPLLAAMLGVDDGSEAWRTLRDLSITELRRDGLRIAPVVRDVIASSLELRDPERARGYRRSAAGVLVHAITGGDSWTTTADLLFLVQNPVVRHAFFPPGGMEHPVEVPGVEDEAAVREIAVRHDGSAGEALIDLWWPHHRADFVVARGATGQPVSFSVVVERRRIAPEVADADPFVAAWDRDLADRPLPAGATSLVCRRALAAGSGGYPSPELSPMWIDIKRTYLELRPDLARVYVLGSDWPGVAATVEPLGFVRLGSPMAYADRLFQSSVLDFGPGSVDGWLARLVDAESRQRPDGSSGGGSERLGSLSRRELEVLAALAQGLSNRELAEVLFISERTANRHLSNIFTKLGVRNRTAAARVAMEAGLAS